MKEIIAKEAAEIKTPTPENFRKIKPEGNSTVSDAKSFWEQTFRTESEPRKEGGSYKEVFVEGEGDKYEIHHMPADCASPLDRDDGPAIRMEKADHRKTASCGSNQEARAYQSAQRELIAQGKFREALQMDIDDIREKFGNKYEKAISEMLAYVDQLEAKGEI